MKRDAESVAAMFGRMAALTGSVRARELGPRRQRPCSTYSALGKRRSAAPARHRARIAGTGKQILLKLPRQRPANSRSVSGCPPADAGHPLRGVRGYEPL